MAVLRLMVAAAVAAASWSTSPIILWWSQEVAVVVVTPFYRMVILQVRMRRTRGMLRAPIPREPLTHQGRQRAGPMGLAEAMDLMSVLLAAVVDC